MKKLNYFWTGVLGVFGAMNAHAQALPQVVLDASQYEISGCEVLLDQGGYNRLYVNGQYAGLYVVVQQDQQLDQAIQNELQTNRCKYKGQQEINLMRSPQLIDDFLHFNYRNCSVDRPGSGYSDFFVHNNFIGSYLVGTEDLKLRSALAQYVMLGACVYGQTPPPPPPLCTCTLSNQWGNFSDAAQSCQVARQEVLNQCSHSNPHAVCQGSEVFCR